ncbi:MAG: hypothetical protein AVDCRST_MAG35-707, partial [uncultured Quadrisphaera sp.]
CRSRPGSPSWGSSPPRAGCCSAAAPRRPGA